MSTRKILHAADIHLDSPLRNLSRYDDAPTERIRGACRRGLENLIDLAIDQRVDLVVIAGDLYDGDWPDQNTGLFFVNQASRLINAEIPLVVIRGNHDALNRMTLNLRLPKNPDGSEVMLSETKVDTREFDFGDLSVAVHGRSYRKQHERGDLVKDYPPPRPGMFNLGLLHTSLTGFSGHTAYAPCTPQQLADFGYDYWALGHIHQRGEHQIDGAAPVVFSGNVQGRKINEPGPKGCVIVEIDSRGSTTRTFHPLDVLRFEVCSIDAASLQHRDDAIDRFEHWLEGKIEEVDDRLLVPRVELVGETELHTALTHDRASIEASLRSSAIHRGAGQVWLEKFKLQTKPPRRSSLASGTRDVDADAMDAGAWASIATIAEQFRPAGPLGDNPPSATAAARHWMQQELELLRQKLPAELSADEPLLDWQDSAQLDDWIQQATAELMSRLERVE
jgi:DNA repair exonuclease SbcCD nuclease subunit